MPRCHGLSTSASLIYGLLFAHASSLAGAIAVPAPGFQAGPCDGACAVDLAELTTFKWVKATRTSTVTAGTVLIAVDGGQRVLSRTTVYNPALVNKPIQTNARGTRYESVLLTSGDAQSWSTLAYPTEAFHLDPTFYVSGVVPATSAKGCYIYSTRSPIAITPMPALPTATVDTADAVDLGGLNYQLIPVVFPIGNAAVIPQYNEYQNCSAKWGDSLAPTAFTKLVFATVTETAKTSAPAPSAPAGNSGGLGNVPTFTGTVVTTGKPTADISLPTAPAGGSLTLQLPGSRTGHPTATSGDFTALPTFSGTVTFSDAAPDVGKTPPAVLGPSSGKPPTVPGTQLSNGPGSLHSPSLSIELTSTSTLVPSRETSTDHPTEPTTDQRPKPTDVPAPTSSEGHTTSTGEHPTQSTSEPVPTPSSTSPSGPTSKEPQGPTSEAPLPSSSPIPPSNPPPPSSEHHSSTVVGAPSPAPKPESSAVTLIGGKTSAASSSKLSPTENVPSTSVKPAAGPQSTLPLSNDTPKSNPNSLIMYAIAAVVGFMLVGDIMITASI